MLRRSEPKKLLLCTAALVAAAVISNAGDLNPPAGPIASTGKPLTEVEPRTAVNAVNTPGSASALFRIAQAGSYYLTGNITGEAGKHGIQIAADGVTLDLNGFALIGVPASLDGVNMSTFLENVVIRNGHVRDWGESGPDTRIHIGRIERITAAGNGAWESITRPPGPSPRASFPARRSATAPSWQTPAVSAAVRPRPSRTVSRTPTPEAASPRSA